MIQPGLDVPGQHFSPNNTALIIGAGLAGCAASRALSDKGYQCVIYDQHPAPCNETSAVPCAVVRPHVTRAEQTSTHYFRQAFTHIHAVLKQTDSKTYANTGALHLVNDASQWPQHHHYSRMTQLEATDAAGTAVASDALYFNSAGWLNPKRLCQHWLANAERVKYVASTRIQSIRKTDYGWQLLDQKEAVIDESPLVIVASAGVAADLKETRHLPLERSRGQISHFAANTKNHTRATNTIVTGKGFIIPTASGFWAGSTHQRCSGAVAPCPQDDRQNLQTALELCPSLAQTLVDADKAETSWVGFRYSTPDRLPVVGGAPTEPWYRSNYADLRHGRKHQHFPPAKFHDGLYLITGFGSRGALHSVFTAEILAGIIAGTPADTSGHTDLVHPGRFLLRQLRRGFRSQRTEAT